MLPLSYWGLLNYFSYQPTVKQGTRRSATVKLLRIIELFFLLTNSKTGNAPQCSTIELSRIIKFIPLSRNIKFILLLRIIKIIYNKIITHEFYNYKDYYRRLMNLSYLQNHTHDHQAAWPAWLRHAFWSSLRPISDSQLRTSLLFHLCPIYLVVFKGSYIFRLGYLILRGASRLDAFSVYPVRTWLPCCAFGNATGTPAVRPSRSSRTKDSSSQISYAHAG